MVYGKFILRIENTNDMYLYNTDEDAVKDINIMLGEWGVNEEANNLDELKVILNDKCEGVHLYGKLAG